jgi:hypothetical protein
VVTSAGAQVRFLNGMVFFTASHAGGSDKNCNSNLG